MKSLQGTWPGWLLNSNRMQISGWTDLSQQDQAVHAGKNFIRLTYPSGFQARFYLIWITSGPAGVADTALLTG